MKKLWIALAFTFALAPWVAAAPAPALTESDERLLALLQIDSEAAVPQAAPPPPAFGGQAWCDQLATAYCRYRWNKVSFCCDVIYTAPGAGCWMMCI
jgi:hypothetical protein